MDDTPTYRLGVDVGGSFTDLLLLREHDGQTWRAKIPSSSEDPSISVIEGINQILTQIPEGCRARPSKEVLHMRMPGPKYGGTAYLSLHRWHFWRNGYNAIASDGEGEGEQYSQECKDVAAKAVAIMNALDTNMTF